MASRSDVEVSLAGRPVWLLGGGGGMIIEVFRPESVRGTLATTFELTPCQPNQVVGWCL